MKVDYYIIRDEKTGKYVGDRFNSISADKGTDVQFVSAKNAEERILEIQKRDPKKAEKLVIVPVSVQVLDPIKPKLRVQKAGWVISNEHGKKPYKRKVYWKGNKDKPYDNVDYRGLLYGPEQALTASIFDSREKAETKLLEIKNAVKQHIIQLKVQQEERGLNMQSTIEEFEGMKFAIEQK